jgi:hypothetical protein
LRNTVTYYLYNNINRLLLQSLKEGKEQDINKRMLIDKFIYNDIGNRLLCSEYTAIYKLFMEV